MATITKGTTFASGDVVTPAKLNNLVDAATISPIVTSDIADSQITTPKIANGAVTSAKLGSDIILVPAGAIMSFAMLAAPTGWLAANGAAVSRATYAALFSAIGTTFGTGDGSTTFNLPDLQGYFVRGAGTNSDGTTAGTFGVKQGDANKSHNHTLQNGGATGTFISGISAPLATNTPSGGALGRITGITTTSASVSYTHPTVSLEGDVETRPKNIALLYCIKF